MKPERWQQIKGLYESALRIDEGERASFLDQACAADPELRRELESLLAYENRQDGFIETPAVEIAARALAEEKRESLVGRQLGSYKILSFLGAGGMGEVYRARDTKLGREVALKVLPEGFARDAERLGRFRREALVLAALNHPNIAAIYGLEESEGLCYLVLELVPGKTLSEWIDAGPLDVREALRICGQIAEGLEAAHESGIVHRDLKPANIKVTAEEKVKVLDFGLAKAVAEGRDLSHSPPATAGGTATGVILGTAAYMSPEQARGKPLNRRTDIWSFGCVLYELLTGQKTFAADTVSDTVVRILGQEPDWKLLPAATPASIRLLLRRCLEKDWRRRLHDIGDARIEIEDAFSAPAAAESSGVAPSGGSSAGWRALRWGLALLVVSAVTGLVVWRVMRTPVPRSPVRLAISLPPREQLASVRTSPVMAFSPDGTRLVYSAVRSGVVQLYLRPIDQAEGKPIPGTEGAWDPFFSPDGKWVGFFGLGGLTKVPIGGGAPVVLGPAFARGASWGPDDTIVFPRSSTSGLWKISAAGGTPQVLTTLDATNQEKSHLWPEVLPGGKAVIFAAGTRIGFWDKPVDGDIVVQSLETGKRQIVIPGATYARYVPSGHLVYARAGTLMAVPFDLAGLRVTGPAVEVVEDVMEASHTGVAQFAVSSLGWLVYVPGDAREEESRLAWIDRKGAVQPLEAPPRAYIWPRLSADGRRVAVTIGRRRSNVWIGDLSRNTWHPLTSDGESFIPVWTHDGTRVTFSSSRSGVPNLFWVRSDGSGIAELLTPSEYPQYPQSWSADGKLLIRQASTSTTGSGSWDCNALSPEGERKPRPFLTAASDETQATFSPDGRFVAYADDESMKFQIFVVPFPDPVARWSISTEGGHNPVWGRDGRELFYRNGAKIMVVDVTTKPTFSAGTPRLLFEAAGESLGYDVAPDGRFLMVMGNGSEPRPTQLNVIQNWFEDLKIRAPVR